jgi:hypothetical protein
MTSKKKEVKPETAGNETGCRGKKIKTTKKGEKE